MWQHGANWRGLQAPLCALRHVGADGSRVVGKSAGFHSRQSRPPVLHMALRAYESSKTGGKLSATRVPTRPATRRLRCGSEDHKSVVPVAVFSIGDATSSLRGALAHCPNTQQLASYEAILRSGRAFTVATSTNGLILLQKEQFDAMDLLFQVKEMGSPSLQVDGKIHPVHIHWETSEVLVSEFVVLRWLIDAYYHHRAMDNVQSLFMELVTKLQAVQTSASEHGESTEAWAYVAYQTTNRFLTALSRQKKYHEMMRFSRENHGFLPVATLMLGKQGKMLINACENDPDAAFELLGRISDAATDVSSIPSFPVYHRAIALNLFRHPDEQRGLANAIAISKWMTEQAGYLQIPRHYSCILSRMINAGFPTEDIMQWMDTQRCYDPSSTKVLTRILEKSLDAQSQQRAEVCLRLLEHFLSSTTTAVARSIPMGRLLSCLLQAKPSIRQVERYVELMRRHGTELSFERFQSLAEYLVSVERQDPGMLLEEIVDQFVAFFQQTATQLCAGDPLDSSAPALGVLLGRYGHEGIPHMRRLVDALFRGDEVPRMIFVDHLLKQLLQEQVDRKTLIRCIQEINALDTRIFGNRSRELCAALLDPKSFPEGCRTEDMVVELVQLVHDNPMAFPTPWALFNFALVHCVRNKWLVACHILMKIAEQHDQLLDLRTVERLAVFHREMQSPNAVLVAIAKRVNLNDQLIGKIPVSEDIVVALLNALLEANEVDRVVALNEALELSSRFGGNAALQQIIVQASKRKLYPMAKTPSRNPKQLLPGDELLPWLQRVFDSDSIDEDSR